MATETVAGALAARLADAASRRACAEALPLARTGLIDTVAVTLLGSMAECTRMVRALPGVADAPGTSLLLGTPVRTGALDAALVNGVAAHADDFDDFTQVFGGHPSSPVLPALVALAEARGASGAALLDAYVAGVELETRLASGVHFHHYEKGWHPTATLGTIGAAGACGVLLGLDGDRLAHALAVAVSLASGVKASFGTMTKPLHVGHANRSGLMAALLAEQGFTGAADAFEHRHGFLEVFNGAGTYDASRMLEGWYDPPAIVDPGLGIKQFPCCGSTHPSVFVALRLREAHGLVAEDIESVEVATHPRRLPHTDNPDPRTGLEARFSIQYAVARALVDGGLRIAHFEGAAPHDARVRALMARLSAGPDPRTPLDGPHAFGARLTVRTRDGRVLEDRVDQLVGRGREVPMSEAELREKFLDCAGRPLGADGARDAWPALGRIGEVERVGEITATFEPSRERSAALTPASL